MRWISPVLLPALVTSGFAGTPAPDPPRLKKDLFYLAGPACAGRGTGESGQTVAATFIAKRMKENGLQVLKAPGMGGESAYHFAYGLSRTTLDRDTSVLIAGETRLKLGEDFITFSPDDRSGEAVLLGYGIQAPELGWDDFQGVDLKGKWAVIFRGQPALPSGPFKDHPNHPAASWEAKQRALQAAGALGLIVLQTGTAPNPAWATEALSRPRLQLEGTSPRTSTRRPPTLLPKGAKALGLDAEAHQRALLEAGRPLPPKSLGIWKMAITSQRESFKATNLIGFLPGSDPELRKEFVVLSAHHDHLGTQGGKMFPGADDNASGTVGILEVGRLLAQAKPRRSILLLSVSGEENGLLGSAAFLAHPPVDLKQIVADLNLDMIGRGAANELHVTPAHVEGAVTSLTRDARELAQRHGVALQDGADTYWQRSDHYNFAQKGIPSLFFFAGIHGDYHEPSDTPDKIDFAKIARVVALTRDLVLKVANAPERPEAVPTTVHKTWGWPSPAHASH